MEPKPPQDRYDRTFVLALLQHTAGWTLERLSVASGVPLATLTAYEEMRKVPTNERFHLLAAVMGFDVPTADAFVFIIQATRFAYRSDIRIDDLPEDPDELPKEIKEELTSAITVKMTAASRNVVLTVMKKMHQEMESLPLM